MIPAPDATVWLPMRTAYDKYAAAIPSPMRFDSFRRLANENKFLSKAEGGQRLVGLQSLEAFIRVKKVTFEQAAVESFGNLLEELGGIPAKQTFLLALVPENIAGCQPLTLGEGPKTKVFLQNMSTWFETLGHEALLAGASFTLDASTTVQLRMIRWAMFAWTWECPEMVDKVEEMVDTVVMGRLLDTLVIEGVLTTVDLDGEVGYQSRAAKQKLTTNCRSG